MLMVMIADAHCGIVFLTLKVSSFYQFIKIAFILDFA